MCGLSTMPCLGIDIQACTLVHRSDVALATYDRPGLPQPTDEVVP